MLRYPYKKIDSSDDYLQIDIVEYVAPGLTTQEGSFALNSSDQTYGNLGGTNSKVKIIETIFLPMPDGIQDSNGAEWGAGSMGPKEAIGANIATRGITNPASIPEEFKSTIGKIGGALNSGLGQQAVQLGIAAEIIKRITSGEGGQNYLERGAGITFNQNIELLFSGVKLREGFTFAFDMVPRSEKEAVEIKKIIRSFKKYSSVRKGLDFGGAEGLFLKAPQVFRLRYMSGGKLHPFLHKFKICALQNMTVNYTGSGTYSTYPDATPTHMSLTLSFQELTPIYYEDYLTRDENGSDDGIGVGY